MCGLGGTIMLRVTVNADALPMAALILVQDPMIAYGPPIVTVAKIVH